MIALFLTHLLAVTFTLHELCSSGTLYEGQVPGVGQSVGRVTLDTLEKQGLPFEGNEAGIQSILETPVGDEAIEVLSDSEMRVYGWCYAVNGVESGKIASEYVLEKETDHLEWYFGYALYQDGEWVEYCTRTQVTQPEFICGS